MKHNFLKVAILFFVLLTLFSVSAAADRQSTRYTVVFNDNAVPKGAARLVEAAGGWLVKILPQVGIGIAVSSNRNFASAMRRANVVHSVGLERFHALPPVEVIEYVDSAPTSTDYLYDLQWNIRRVRADQAWPITSGSHDTVVAVIDTGVASNHPDLADNLVYAECFSTAAECSEYPDLSWHGTHVAGIIAAAFDGGSVVGVGPNLGLASYNVFELVSHDGDGDIVAAYEDSIWEAMLDAAEQGFDVINMSLGGYLVFPASREDVATWTAWNRVANYVIRQGVTIVASAGNDNFNLNGPVAHIPSDLPNVVSVGATGIRPDPSYPQEDAYNVCAFYSNVGATITLCAPGGDCGLDDTCEPGNPANWFYYMVLSDYVDLDPACVATASCPVGYAWAAGTSMASPHVAGSVGLFVDRNPNLKPYQVTAIIKQTAETLGNRRQFGHGMVDAFAAVSK